MNGIFNNPDFYPTPQEVIFKMLAQVDVSGKTILEPSAGKGDIIDALTAEGANVLYCENSAPLKKILEGKGKFLTSDFLTVTSDQISHINGIVMNPPFSEGVKHILHAFEILPKGAFIVSLINHSNIINDYSAERKQLKTLIENNGLYENLGDCFSVAERKTGVEVGMIYLQKAGENFNEFEGFFLDDEPEQCEGVEGIMKYDLIRDLVNRYVQACKIYEEQLQTAVKLNNVVGSFFSQKIGFQCTNENYNTNKTEFKKDLQRDAWKYIFNKLELEKDMTRGVRETINKFVEQQQQVPFTMKNIYRMLEIIIGTRAQTMDKAIEEAFDRITEKHHDNRHNIKGWKTNLHYLVGKKFILPYMISPAKEYGYTTDVYTSLRSSYDGVIPDLEKALCFIVGKNYKEITTVNGSINRNYYGGWYSSEFLKYKGYKNGNMHFEFVSDEVWGKFNQRVAKIKGYPLFEHKEQTDYQKRNAGMDTKKSNNTNKVKANVLFEVSI